MVRFEANSEVDAVRLVVDWIYRVREGFRTDMAKDPDRTCSDCLRSRN